MPYGDGDIDIEKEYLDEKHSIFDVTLTKNSFHKFVAFLLKRENTINDKNKNVQEQEIVSVYSLENTNNNIYRCILELKNGYLIAENTIGIYGTGQACIWLFNSKEHLK